MRGNDAAGWNGARSPRVLRVPGVDALTRLALAARNGDQIALDRLVEGSYEQVWRLCARLVDDQCADDLAQDAFLRAVGSLSTFRGDASFRTWLLAIARNTCMDELRTRIRQRHRDEAIAARHTTGAEAVDAGQEMAVTDVLARLTPDRREAFVLTQMLGLSYDEAAQVCACPTGTIRSRVARARADLLATLASIDRDGTSGSYKSESSMYPMTRDMTS
jgi:RNA polymerase sigma-70 factor (ECF subfamily)